jgi:hypothetical protein
VDRCSGAVRALHTTSIADAVRRVSVHAAASGILRLQGLSGGCVLQVRVILRLALRVNVEFMRFCNVSYVAVHGGVQVRCCHLGDSWV